MLVLSVIQKKGGVGKTFSALSIALELVFLSKRKLKKGGKKDFFPLFKKWIFISGAWSESPPNQMIFSSLNRY